MSRISPKRALLVVTTATALSVGGAIAVAQDPAAPPTVAFKLGKLKSTPTGPATAPAGAVRFVVSTAQKGQGGFQLLRVADGADVAALQAKVRKVDSGDKFEALKELTAVGGTSVTKTAKGVITVTLIPGTYLFVDFSDEKVSPNIPFSVAGDPATAPALPAPDATLSLFDYKFELTGKLPRNGTVRMVNKGKRNHIVVTFKTQNAAGSARLVKALKANNERAVGKEIRGEGPGANLIGPGQSQDLKFTARPGNYVFVCFYGSKQSKGKDHNALGMVKAVTVK